MPTTSGLSSPKAPESRKFGQTYAAALHCRRAPPGDKWPLDAVFLKINGKTYYLWRAVDQHGTVQDILVTARRDKQAALRLFRKLLKRCRYVPRVIITDKLASYRAAKKEILPGVEPRQHKGLNNRSRARRFWRYSHQSARLPLRQSLSIGSRSTYG